MNLNQILGLRVKEARKRLGMSQQELGELLEVEHAQIISQIESGERQIKAWELARLSAILHTSVTDLLKEETLPEPVVLWREQPDKNYQKIETEFVQQSRNYDLVEKLSGVRSKSQLRPADIPGEKLDYREAAELANEAAKALNLGRVPATSLTKVLEEDFGVKIFYRENLAGSAASAVGDFGQSILMNSSEAPWRRNYNFAHELFHLLTWNAMPPDRLRKEQNLKEKFEKLANYFASCLLLPAECVLTAFQAKLNEKKISFADLIEIAREFDVSTEALLWRLVNLRQIDREEVRKAQADLNFRMLDRTTMAERWSKPEDLSDRYVRLCFLCFQKEQISRAKLAELLGISLAELRGKVKELEQPTSEAALSVA
jgi:Zn-dependent peptidase ImmA (M78 family)/transcriptional regulator with XRE-family HTH domain